MTESELWTFAGSLGLPLDDGPTMEVLRLRIRRASY
jgi:hypothetical protein